MWDYILKSFQGIVYIYIHIYKYLCQTYENYVGLCGNFLFVNPVK